jgi:hypothetical protein
MERVNPILSMEIIMMLRHLFTINLPIAVFFGLVCAVLPEWTIQLYGLDSNEAAIWTTRLTGGSILAFATLMWYGRTRAAVETRRAIALALLAQDAIGAIASIEIQLKGSANAFGWTSPILYVFLALGYAWFVFIRPADC